MTVDTMDLSLDQNRTYLLPGQLLQTPDLHAANLPHPVPDPSNRTRAVSHLHLPNHTDPQFLPLWEICLITRREMLPIVIDALLDEFQTTPCNETRVAVAL